MARTRGIAKCGTGTDGADSRENVTGAASANQLHGQPDHADAHLASQEDRGRDIELRTYDMLEAWLRERSAVLSPADHQSVERQHEPGFEQRRDAGLALER